MFKKIFCVFLVAALMYCNLLAMAEVNGYMTFTQEELYATAKPLSTLPLTFEANVYFPADTDTNNVILGNYKNGSTASVSLFIQTSGYPRLYIVDNDGTKYDFKFGTSSVYTGEWVHIAVRLYPDTTDSDGNAISKATYYLNGVSQQTKSGAVVPDITFANGLCVGGDLRSSNTYYFKGQMKYAAVWKKTLSASKISEIAATPDMTHDNVISSWDFSTVEEGVHKISDASGNRKHLYSSRCWLEDYESATDYAYSFAVIGDTQTLTDNNPATLTCIYDWIVDNAGEKNIKFVFGLGDIVNDDTDIEWALAKAVIQKMNGVVPYSLIRGNHDGKEQYNKYLPYSEFGGMVDGTYDGTMINTYKKFKVGSHKYLVMNLDYNPSGDLLEWAGDIISEHPDCNVIVTTHAYLDKDGTLSTSGGEAVWTNLASKYDNIVLVLGGHHPSDTIVMKQTEGDNGNTVTQMLIDPQYLDRDNGAAGLVAMLYFSEDGKNVDVEYYSTVRDAWFLEENQFSVTLDTVEPTDTDDEVAADTMTVSDISCSVSLAGEQISGTVYGLLYNKYNKLVSVKSYTAAETVEVSFDSAEEGSYVKVMWWDDEFTPYLLAKTTVEAQTAIE